MPPTPEQLLGWIAAAGAGPWFPASQGLTRDAIDMPLTRIWQAGLVEAGDWVKGKGQGFRLTEEGQRVLSEPALLGKLLSGTLAPNAVKPPEAPRLVGPTTFDRGEAARRAILTPPPLVVMPILVVLNVALFLIGFILAAKGGPGRLAYLKGEDTQNLFQLGGLTADALLRGEGWRLAASAFLHAGIMHLVLNLYMLVVCGARVEACWGRWRFLAIYFGSALAGACLAIALRPQGMLVGASGAIFGLLTADAVWMLKHRQHFDEYTNRRYRNLCLINLGISVVVGFSVPRVSWEGHLGGAIAGVLLALACYYIRPGWRRKTSLAVAALVVLLIAPVPLLLLYIRQSEAWQPHVQLAVLQQRLQFDQAHAKALAPIYPMKVEGLIQQSLLQMKKSLNAPKQLEQAGELRVAAVTAAEELRHSDAAGLLTRTLPGRAAAYADAVALVAMTLEELLSGKSDELTALDAPLAAMRQAWQEWHQFP